MKFHRTRTAPHPTAGRGARPRGAAVAAGLAAVLLPLGLAAPAVAATGTASGPAAASERTAAASDPAERIESFYDSYVSALGENDQQQATELRRTNLTAAFRKELARWEEANGADGVTRAQNVPVDADAVYDGSGMGHTWAIVTLRWDGSSETTKVHVQAELETGKIDGIKLYED